MVKDHDGTGPLYYNTTDGVPMLVGGPGQWMACMDSNGPLIYATRGEALDKVEGLREEPHDKDCPVLIARHVMTGIPA